MNRIFIEKIYKKLGCPIHYWISKGKSKKWLIFLHGAGCDHKMFDKQLEYIPNKFSILIWDARGHGKSRPIGEGFTFDILVNDIINIMDVEECRKAVFIGHSLGGNIVQEISFRYPARVESMVLIGCKKNTKRLRLSEKIEMKLTPASLKVYPWNALIKQNKKVSGFSKEVRDYIDKTYRSIGKDDFIRIFNEATKVYHYEKNYKINRPILYLYGEYDKTVDIKKDIDCWQKSEENCICHRIKGAAHNANQDNYNRVNDLIVKFLNNRV